MRVTIRGKNTKLDIAKEINIARPPADGIGTLLIRLAFGLSTAPIRNAKKRTKGVSTTAITIVTIKTITYLSANGIIPFAPFSTHQWPHFPTSRFRALEEMVVSIWYRL